MRVMQRTADIYTTPWHTTLLQTPQVAL